MRTHFLAGVAVLFALLCGVPSTAQKPKPSDEVGSLIWLLVSSDKAERTNAAELLGRFGNAAKNAVEPLALALRSDSDPTVSHNAAVALARIGKPGVKYLAEALKDKDAAVRQRAAAALALIGPDARSATAALLQILKDDNPQVRGSAAYALGEIGGDSERLPAALCQALTDSAADVRRQAGVALAALGEEAVPALGATLKSDDVNLRISAAQVLAAVGPDAREAAGDLALLLKDKNPQVRAAGASALAALGKEAQDALPALLDQLRDEKEPDAQQMTFQAIMLIGSEDVPGLLGRLREINAEGNWAAPFVLRQFGNKASDAVPFLIKMLNDANAGTRLGAVTALGAIGSNTPEVMQSLAKSLHDSNFQVRAAAAMSLTKLDPKRRELAEKQLQAALAQARAFMKQLHEAEQRRQKELAMLTEAKIRQTAFWEIFRPLNRQALTDPKVQNRYDQLINLHILLAGGEGGKSVSPALSQEMSALSTEVRKQVGRLGPEAVPALIRGIKQVGDFKLGFC